MDVPSATAQFLPGRLLARAFEGFTVGVRELLHGHCGPAGYRLDEAVGAGKDAVAVVLCHVAQMLDEKRRSALHGERPTEGRYVDRFVRTGMPRVVSAMWNKVAFITTTAVLTCLLGDVIGPIGRTPLLDAVLVVLGLQAQRLTAAT
ncbi:MAG: hypothetical protein QOI01_6603 [Mycobacterium sp.]|nr:hypothetical protein [Mycobacterium sp.]